MAETKSILSQMVATSVAQEAHVTNFFDALRELRRVELELATPYGRGDAMLAARAKELKGYKDVFLKAEAQRRPRFTVMDRRADRDAPIVVELQFSNGVQFYESLHLSLTKGGLFIKTDTLLPIDSMLEVHCKLEEEDISFKVSAKVVWINPRDSQWRPAGMGLKLMRMSSVQLQVIEDFTNGETQIQTLSHLSE